MPPSPRAGRYRRGPNTCGPAASSAHESIEATADRDHAAEAAHRHRHRRVVYGPVARLTHLVAARARGSAVGQRRARVIPRLPRSRLRWSDRPPRPASAASPLVVPSPSGQKRCDPSTSPSRDASNAHPRAFRGSGRRHRSRQPRLPVPSAPTVPSPSCPSPSEPHTSRSRRQHRARRKRARTDFVTPLRPSH